METPTPTLTNPYTELLAEGAGVSDLTLASLP